MNARAARAIAVTAIALVQTACLPAPARKGPLPEPGGATGPTIKSAGTSLTNRPALGPKRVQGKQPPNRLLAHDGTSCLVSREKYEKTTIGTSIWCVWTDTDR